MDRRSFLKLTGAGVASALAVSTGCKGGSSTGPLPDNTRKNLLFILCDDLNDHVNGFGGHPQAHTPNIDRLRAMGVTFTNTHANVPVCAPSRASLLSGLLPSSTGHYIDTPASFRDRSALRQAKLITEHLRDNSYQVYITGKVFHDAETLRTAFGVNNSWNTTRYLGYLASYGPYIWNGLNVTPNTIPNPAFPTPIQDQDFGFGRLSAPPRHSNGVAKWYYGNNKSYMGADGLPGGEFSYTNPQIRSLVPDELSANWVVSLLTGQKALSYDKDGRAKIANPIANHLPFAIFCGLTSTHTPLYLPDDLFDEVLAANNITSVDDIMLPPLLPGDLAYLKGNQAGSLAGEHDLTDIPARLNPINNIGRYKYSQMINAGQTWPGGAERLFKETIHAYLAAVLMLDRQVGKMLDALEASGLLDKTMIVLTSDNGYARTEKNWDFKFNLWGESTRVPLVIHDPDIAGGLDKVVDAPTSLVDLYPSIIQACALPALAVRPGQLPLEGSSLYGLMGNDPTGRPPAVFSMMPTSKTPLADDLINPDTAAVSAVSRYWRYTQSYVENGVQEELYNHRVDPNEWHNLATDPSLMEVKQFFDYQISRSLACGDMHRTRIYADYEPNGFDPDLLA